MKSQLYVPEITRNYLKSEIQSFTEIYFQKLFPIFKDIESDAEKHATAFYDDFMSQPTDDEYIDPSSIADQALNIGIEHYSYLKLGRYTLTASWHATLYQLWEQQSRLFLFREMSHVYRYQLETFCTKLSQIKDKYKFHNVDIEKFSCWTRLEELSLLCNVIKHGDGASAKKLRQINPALFKQEDKVDYMEVFKSTLLQESLNINEGTLNNYREALLYFWDEFPERSYSS